MMNLYLYYYVWKIFYSPRSPHSVPILDHSCFIIPTESPHTSEHWSWPGCHNFSRATARPCSNC